MDVFIQTNNLLLSHLFTFFTARKRSLGQGYIFAHVCHSVRRGGAIPACIAGGIHACLVAGLRGRGVVVSQHALQVSRPTPRGRGVEGSGLWGSPGPHPGGVSRPTPGAIPACTEADPPTALAVGSTHPTGMHSCCV